MCLTRLRVRWKGSEYQNRDNLGLSLIDAKAEVAMARPLRIEFRGATEHVMARGSHGQPIFADDSDRKRFLDTLEESCQRTGWHVYA